MHLFFSPRGVISKNSSSQDSVYDTGMVIDFKDTEKKKEELQSLENNKKYVGKTVPVLIEGPSDKNDKLMGYTDTMKLVNIEGDSSYIGEIVNVEITEAKTWSLEGVIKSDR